MTISPLPSHATCGVNNASASQQANRESSDTRTVDVFEIGVNYGRGAYDMSATPPSGDGAPVIYGPPPPKGR